jgi:pimeloyl-ACP methyl ester carboxylesterase
MPREIQLTINGSNLSAQEWGEQGELPVLALHGWLDNSASFSALAPQLRGVHLIAIDMAGHGKSDHRPGVGPYHIWDDVPDVFAIADFFGWEKFALLGHSRGAIVAMLAAGTFPERITHVALVEGLLPEPGSVTDAPQQLATSIKTMQVLAKKSLSIYASLDEAITARERGMFPLSRTAATILTERGVKVVAGGFAWSTDQRLFAPSAIKLTREHIQVFIQRITAPIKLILAQDGIPKRFSNYQREISVFPNVDVHNLPGGHHLHMEQESGLVANSLNLFFDGAKT